MSNIDLRNTWVKNEDGTMTLVSSTEIVYKSTETTIEMTDEVSASIAQRMSGLDYEGQPIEE